MNDSISPPKSPKPPRAESKADRLAAALRANLARRKAQARERSSRNESGDAPDNEQG